MADDDRKVSLPTRRAYRGGGQVVDAQTDGRIAPVQEHIVTNDREPEGEDGLFDWLRDNPDFIDRPATIEQFLGENYLNIDDSIRPGIRRALIEIFGGKVNPSSISEKRRAMMTGGIGIGKTTFASIAIPYMVHWVLCLHDPQKYFGLMPGSRIAFMLMSTTDSQAKEVLFGDIKARLAISPWFRRGFMYSDKFKNQLRFPKDIWVLPGNSQETTFEGYNILGGIIDEGDSHKVTSNKDYAQEGWNTIHSRISSRFSDPITGSHRGLLIAIGQMKSAAGFMSRKKKELQHDPEASVVTMTIWESYGWSKYKRDGKFEVFWYDIDRKEIVSAEYARDVNSPSIIPVPNAFHANFIDNPIKALRDLAGIPPLATDPFIVLMNRVETAQIRWKERFPHLRQAVTDSCTSPQFEPGLIAGDALMRVLHVDVAYSDAITADALGMTMSHVSHMVEMENGEVKPYIVVDFMLRMKTVPGRPILLGDVRNLIYQIKDDRGFRLKLVTLDGVQSIDTIQMLNKRRIPADYLSVDRNKQPYEDLRESIYESRIEMPEYITFIKPGSTERVNIATQEISQLNDEGKKIDHPPGGSKDVADCLAANVHVLSGSAQYRRGLRRLANGDQNHMDELRADVIDEYGSPVDLMTNRRLSAAELGIGSDAQLVAALGGTAASSTMTRLPRAPHGMPELEENPFGILPSLRRNVR